MAVPKRKVSKSRKGLKRSHAALAMPNIPRSQKTRAPGSRSHRFFCTNCNQPKAPHAVCPNCGHYMGRTVVDVE